MKSLSDLFVWHSALDKGEELSKQTTLILSRVEEVKKFMVRSRNKPRSERNRRG